MPGPPPKPPGQRRRRNKQPKAERLPVKAGRKAPPLPEAERMLPPTRAWWATVWSAPMAAVYLDADVPALARLATLIDRMNQGESSSRLLSEIRSLEDRFGLSPLARRRLQWEVEQAAAVSSPAGDEERWLRVVSD
jgi:hypothetical protein